MEVKINVINEMKKLRETTYANKYAWVKELIQNGQRANASHIRVTTTPTTIIIEDDGVGCTNPEALFEKNVSGWDDSIVKNENPFGEGFFSTLMAANMITVESVGFKCVFDVERMFRENTADVITIESNNRKSGFKITLTNLLKNIDWYMVDYHFNEIGKYIKKPSIFVNGDKVKYQGVTPNTNKPFIHYIDNDYFKGWIRPYSWKNDDWDTAIVKCFAFDRLVKDSTKTSGVYGVIHFKPNAVNLRSPDREEFIFDDKYDVAYSVFLNEVRKMFIKVVRYGTDKQIKNFDDLIDKYTTIDDYKKFIKFKFYGKNATTTKGSNSTDIDAETAETSNAIAASVTNTAIRNINDAEYNTDNHDTTFTAPTIKRGRKKVEYENENCNQSGDKIDGRSSYGFYVKSDETSNYTDHLAIADYYNIPVVEIRNRLEENIIRDNKKFQHISAMADNIKLKCKYSNSTPKSEFEIRVLKLLNRIMEAINVKGNLFVICDTDINRVLEINGKVKPIEKVDALATAYKGKIYLDRKYLYAYKNLNTESNELTMEDIRFVMLNLETICHEMSHALYGNSDNTKAHLECINYLMQKIINVVFNCTDKPIYI